MSRSLLVCACAGAAMICGLTAGCYGAPPGDGVTGTALSAPPASQKCDYRPSAKTTGATGSLPTSSVTKLHDGDTLTNSAVDHLLISGDDVTVRNVEVSGTVGITGNRVVVDHVTTGGVSISSASHVTVTNSDIGFGPGDGIHVTSDHAMVRDVNLHGNYVHDPKVKDSAHYDGVQVRGVEGLSITCSVFDAGPYKPMYNAGIYLEDANGGDSNITVAHNWVFGFGFSIMMDARNTTLESNQIGGDVHWGTCRLGKRTGNPGLRSLGNIDVRTNQPLSLCTNAEPG